MDNIQHAEIDFDFVINGEVFQQLYYLVDCSYLSLTCWLTTINYPLAKLDQYSPTNRKAVKSSVSKFLEHRRESFYQLDTWYACTL